MSINFKGEGKFSVVGIEIIYAYKTVDVYKSLYVVNVVYCTTFDVGKDSTNAIYDKILETSASFK